MVFCLANHTSVWKSMFWVKMMMILGEKGIHSLTSLGNYIKQNQIDLSQDFSEAHNIVYIWFVLEPLC